MPVKGNDGKSPSVPMKGRVSKTPLNGKGMSSEYCSAWDEEQNQKFVNVAQPWNKTGTPNLKHYVWHMMTVPEGDDRTFDSAMHDKNWFSSPQQLTGLLRWPARRSKIVTIDTMTG